MKTSVGFTLVEMVIVLGILVLVVAVVLSMGGTQSVQEARAMAMAQSMEQLSKAAATYALNHSLTTFLGRDGAVGGTTEAMDVTLQLLSAPPAPEAPYVSPLLLQSGDANPFGGTYDLFPFVSEYVRRYADVQRECGPGSLPSTLSTGMPQYDMSTVAVVASNVPADAMPALAQHLQSKTAGLCLTSDGTLVGVF